MDAGKVDSKIKFFYLLAGCDGLLTGFIPAGWFFVVMGSVVRMLVWDMEAGYGKS